MTEQRSPDLQLFDAGAGYLFFIGKCARCEGLGYHWGFGEHGHDPDWCSVCGGSGSISKDVVTAWET